MNKILVTAVVAVAVLLGVGWAQAADLRSTQGRFDAESIVAQTYKHKINTDYGGSIAQFIEKYEALRDDGARIELRGTCVSACTLMLGIFKREDICAGPLARWAFHSAHMPTPMGPLFSYEGTRFIWGMYPDDVKAKLIEKGWNGDEDKPHPELVYFKGTDLVRPCE